MTKLDQEYVKSIRETKSFEGGFETLVNEVVRLEAIVTEAVRIIRQGKAQFAPHTTNSDADQFLAEHA